MPIACPRRLAGSALIAMGMQVAIFIAEPMPCSERTARIIHPFVAKTASAEVRQKMDVPSSRILRLPVVSAIFPNGTTVAATPSM